MQQILLFDHIYTHCGMLCFQIICDFIHWIQTEWTEYISEIPFHTDFSGCFPIFNFFYYFSLSLKAELFS